MPIRSVGPVMLLVLAAACTGSEETPPATTSEGPASGWETSMLDVQPSGQLRVATYGSGDPWIVVHGGPGMDHTYLVPGLEPFADGRRLVLYDQRGTGGSVVPLDTAHVSVGWLVSDLDRLRASLGVERVNVLGHSWGAFLALAYAVRFPERVDRLALVGATNVGAHRRDVVAEASGATRSPEDREALQALTSSEAFQRREPEAVREMYRISFRGAMADPELVDSIPLDLDERTLQEGFTVMQALGAGGIPDLWSHLSSVRAPTLFVHGSADPMPLSVVREMADSIPDATVEVIDGAGHFPWIEQPGPFFETLASFAGD